MGKENVKNIPINKQNLLFFFWGGGGGGGISPPKGPAKTQPETAITFTSTSKLQ